MVGLIDGIGYVTTNGGSVTDQNGQGGGGGRVLILSSDVRIPLNNITASRGTKKQVLADGTIVERNNQGNDQAEDGTVEVTP